MPSSGETSTAVCGFVPPTPGFAPCTRAAGHDGPCAHPETCATAYSAQPVSDYEAAFHELTAQYNARADDLEAAWVERDQLSEALRSLVRIHHNTMTPSRKHDPENREWTECDCLTCKAVQRMLDA